MPRALLCAALLCWAFVPLEFLAASPGRLVAVPDSDGKDCVDLDSRWGVGAILAWKQTICGSRGPAIWVQTDCSQNFAQDGFWLATSRDGRNFARKKKYDADSNGSGSAQFVCFTVGR